MLRKNPRNMRPIIVKSGLLKPVKRPKSGVLNPDKKQSKKCSDIGLEAFKREFEPCFGPCLTETSCVQRKLAQSSGSRSAARVAFTAMPDLGTEEKVRRILLRLMRRE